MEYKALTLPPTRTVLVLLPKIYLPFFLLELSEKGIKVIQVLD